MKIAYFDTISGISGDMTLGAFISAGLAIDELSNEIQKLNIKGIELESAHVVRNGIAAVKVEVVISAGQKHHRHLNDINNIIDASSLNDRIKLNSRKIFHELAAAESKVHNVPVNKVHFHEVGALDSIIDVVGAAICLDKFGIDAVYSSPVKLGSGGLIESEHGKIPLPAPATAELLKNYQTILTDIPYELTTPTGAAIIKATSAGVLSTEKINIERIGYGAGSREMEQVPNLLRVMIGELVLTDEADEVIVIETNIDDMNPEIYPFVIEELLQNGAHDAFLTPIIMKKGRPGIQLSILADRTKLDEIISIIFLQTTAIGVRIQSMGRRKIPRNSRVVQSTIGPVKMKVVVYAKKEKLIPEFEECKRLAGAKNIPLREVYKILESEFG